jgi:hypothetical protein
MKSSKWPKEFKEVIPKKVRELCDEEYSAFDKNLYPDVQVDIAKKLLKLRTTFHENVKVGKSYRVDFKLVDLDKVIVLKGDDQMNTKSNEWLGLYSMKQSFLSRKLKGTEVILIDIEKWKKMSEEEQYGFLYQLSRSRDS